MTRSYSSSCRRTWHACRGKRRYDVLSASAGFYQAVEWNQQRFPRLQILTIADLLAGKEIQYPKALNVTFKVAPKGQYIEPENQELAL